MQFNQIQQFDLTKGKNAADMALIIDVMDILCTKGIDVIFLVSSDCDFTSLVTRTLADGKLVIGFGEQKAPLAFVNSCSKFLYFDNEIINIENIEEAQDIEEVKITSKKQVKTLNRDTKLINLLRQAIDASALLTFGGSCGSFY